MGVAQYCAAPFLLIEKACKDKKGKKGGKA